MIAVDHYCREIEAYLCRKNDGHLIRIAGPAFERVTSWAQQGIPLNVALRGVDRYFERYYRKGPKRRPVRIEFCEADVLDTFDEWRRAVGVTVLSADVETATPVEEPVPDAPRARRSLRAHIESVLARLTVLRGSDKLGGVADSALAAAVRTIEPLLHESERARGEQRQRVVDSLSAADNQLIDALEVLLPEGMRAEYDAEAARELEPFRSRMTEDAYRHARRAVVRRRIREEHGLPEISA